MIEIKLDEKIAINLKQALRLKQSALEVKSADYPKYSADYSEMIDGMLLKYVDVDILENNQNQKCFKWEAQFFPVGKLKLEFDADFLTEKELAFLDENKISYTIIEQNPIC